MITPIVTDQGTIGPLCPKLRVPDLLHHFDLEAGVIFYYSIKPNSLTASRSCCNSSNVA